MVDLGQKGMIYFVPFYFDFNLKTNLYYPVLNFSELLRFSSKF